LLNDAIAQNLSLKEITQRIKQLKQPTAKPPSLKNRFQETLGRLQKAKFWNNPKKHKKLERLLLQMEALLDEE